MSSEILLDRTGSAGRISLNRPKAIHALTRDMCKAMTTALLEWRDDAGVQAIVIDHAEGRGFCAGGDINLLRHSALTDGGAAARDFFRTEYRLNHLLFTYPKPVIAFMDGITMGGGVGISQPARYRIATAQTRFAMPETAIGLFPDVGASHYLSNLQNGIGQFLALTGARLDGADCLWAGLADYHLPGDRLGQAKFRIADDPGSVAAILEELSEPPPESALAAQADLISRHFDRPSLDDILASLAADEGDWACRQLAALRARNPHSCKVALHQLQVGAAMSDFADTMRMEYRIGSRMVTLPNFAEGVRAVIVDKTNDPRWEPATAEEVDEGMVEAMFALLPADEEWQPL